MEELFRLTVKCELWVPPHLKYTFLPALIEHTCASCLGVGVRKGQKLEGHPGLRKKTLPEIDNPKEPTMP